MVVETRDLIHGAIVVGLLFIALYMATKLGYIHCSAIPHWCSLYSHINTMLYGRVYPYVGILHSDKGMGDPAFLEKYLREVCGLHVRRISINRVGKANLDDFDVIIVERAQYLDAYKLEILWDYVAKGGKLVIIGDVGIKGPEGEYLTWEDLGEEGNKDIVNVWDRKTKDGRVIRFGTELLGLKYIDAERSVTTLRYMRDILTEGMSDVTAEVGYVKTVIVGDSVLGPLKVVATINKGKEEYPAIVRVGFRLFYFAYTPEEATIPGTTESVMGQLLLYRNLCRVIT